MKDGLSLMYTKHLRRYDPDLYADRNRDGVVCVYKKGRRAEPVLTENGMTLFSVIDSPEYIFSLTDTWRSNGQPREWGIDRVIARLRSIDLWNDPDALDKLDRENEKVEESKRRDFRNQTESYLLDNKHVLRKAFNDVNTSTLSKAEARKARREKGKDIKYGNR